MEVRKYICNKCGKEIKYDEKYSIKWEHGFHCATLCDLCYDCCTEFEKRLREFLPEPIDN